MTANLQHQDTKNWFSKLFQLYEEALNGQSNQPIAHFRKAAFEQFSSEEFPTLRDEDWKYTSVKRIFQNRFQEGSKVVLQHSDIQDFIFEDLNSVNLVFINGRLDKTLSNFDKLPEEVQLLSVAEALKNEANKIWIEQQVQQAGGTGKNTFLAFNRAFANDGIFIKVAKNYVFDRPIHLLNINIASEDAHLAHPQLFVWAQQSSQVEVIESYHSLSEQGTYFNNAAKWIDVEANANVHHYKLQLEGKTAYQINNTLVRQERDSVYSSYAVDLGGKMVRNNISTDLRASGIESNLYGTYLGDDDQHIDNQTFIDHAMPHCQSNELYKGILTDKARGIFNGKVMVRQDAQKTNAFQQNSSLVLSPRAVMDAKPQLEIYADDVRCSHGATIGQLDEASIFYLRSRGIPEAKAKNLLQKAFIGEVIENFKHESIRTRVLQLVEEKLG